MAHGGSLDGRHEETGQFGTDVRVRYELGNPHQYVQIPGAQAFADDRAQVSQDLASELEK